MPCNTVITNTVELKNVKNHNLLHAALRAKYGEGNVEKLGDSTFRFKTGGYAVVITDGVASSRMGEEALQGVVSQVKQAYARKAVEVAARRFGWTVAKGLDANNFYIQKGV